MVKISIMIILIIAFIIISTIIFLDAIKTFLQKEVDSIDFTNNFKNLPDSIEN